MQRILDSIRQSEEYRRLRRDVEGGASLGPQNLPRAARLPVLSALQADLHCTCVLVTDRADHALALWEQLGFWTACTRSHFAEPNSLFFERSPWSAAVRRDRLQTLTALAVDASEGGVPLPAATVIVASARAIMTRTMPVKDFLDSIRSISRGMHVRPEHLRRDLSIAGYSREQVVLEPGQFAMRGGILDVWSPSSSLPARLEFVGEEVDSIRTFDPVTQRTSERAGGLEITPAREYLASESQQSAREDGSVGPPSEFDIPRLHPGQATLIDYLPSDALVVIYDAEAVGAMVDEIERQALDLRRSEIEDGMIGPDFPMPYVSWSELMDQLASLRTLNLGRGETESWSDEGAGTGLASVFHHDQRFGGRLKPFVGYLRNLVEAGDEVTVVTRQRDRLAELWKEEAQNIDFSKSAAGAQPDFVEASLEEGFAFGATHVITDSEIFGWDRPAARPYQRPIAEPPEAAYSDLQVGDYVVHIDHGIARYLGIARRKLDGREREYLELEYDSGGKLFVPVHQADRLTRYVGNDGLEPSLDRLGGPDWQEKKGRVQRAVIEVAQDMLALHARREIARGHAFGPDTPWQGELEAAFPYVETEDQVKALREIKADMERARPMDRLLCGDVGYGKTELALRAGFKAVMGGKQVAILVPTTVLAQQHYETFQQRLAAFPVQIEMLSRFRSPREQEGILAALAAGEIDIVIGTHRLLSADVKFKELGLVVIDEEQRFGVSHKEHLKQLRTEVDVLTLTATPIPRTLYMALTGVRDISNLNSAPAERLPVVTHVGPYSPRISRQAILRELERGGQTFFVHNRVNTIEAMRLHLCQLVPEARIDVGHGQMPEHELAEVMHRFYRGSTDVLLSTTIIESGLDVPNANTLIVDRADTFGLAQLYQLRGRVGRGAARAYAYFFRHRGHLPTLDAQQRLDVIAENTELGSGYSIAMRDLEIRGAGELLGTQQHGHIQAVGFHLYTRLLADAVHQLRREVAGTSARDEAAPRAESPILHVRRPLSLAVSVDLPLAVGIPEDYVADMPLRLRLYRRIADVRDEAEIEALEEEFKDRFGPLPVTLSNLLYQIRVKILAERARLSSVSWEGGQLVLRYPPSTASPSGTRLRDLGPGIRGGKGAFWCNFANDDDWMARLLNVLEVIPEAAASQPGIVA